MNIHNIKVIIMDISIFGSFHSGLLSVMTGEDKLVQPLGGLGGFP